MSEEKKDRNRKITILTWGVSKRKRAPQESQRNFDVRKISYRKYAKDLDLEKLTGMDNELKQRIAQSPKFQAHIDEIVRELEEQKSLLVISINCWNGHHRSVSVANVLKDKYYPNATVLHLEINQEY